MQIWLFSQAVSALRVANTHTFTLRHEPHTRGREVGILFNIIMPLRVHKNWCKRRECEIFHDLSGNLFPWEIRFSSATAKLSGGLRSCNGFNLRIAQCHAVGFGKTNGWGFPPIKLCMFSTEAGGNLEILPPAAPTLSEKAAREQYGGCCASYFIARAHNSYLCLTLWPPRANFLLSNVLTLSYQKPHYT